MKNISLFDVIGPNMIGPSSSHTAGALRISLIAYKMMRGDIVQADFTLFGSFAKTYKGHGTDRALLAGVMGFDTEDERIKDSFKIADEAGLKYSFATNETEKDVHPNTVEIVLTSSNGETKLVRGESIGGGNVQITKIDDAALLFTGQYKTLLVRHVDRPGMIAYMSNILTEYNINIANMRSYREEKRVRAMAIFETDEHIDAEVIDVIKQHGDVISAQIIEM